jgi:hypothetical protein
MLPETRALLEEFYAPFNQKLAQLMGDDERYLWKDLRRTSAAASAAAAAA